MDTYRAIYQHLPSDWWRRPGRPWQTWLATIRRDMWQLGIELDDVPELATDHALWRGMTGGTTHHPGACSWWWWWCYLYKYSYLLIVRISLTVFNILVHAHDDDDNSHINEVSFDPCKKSTAATSNFRRLVTFCLSAPCTSILTYLLNYLLPRFSPGEPVYSNLT